MGVNRYLRCSECSGTGSTSLKISCNKCSGQGKIKCDNCRDGYVVCVPCNGTGKQRALVFFSATCPACQGKSRVQCTTCRGTQLVNCKQCTGSGQTSISKPCIGCAGKGKVEDPKFRSWLNSLEGFSVDRLRDEKSRRQHKIQDSRSKIGQLQATLRDGWNDWETDSCSSNNLRHGWTPSTWGENQEISQLEGLISELEEEIDIVQDILDRKMR